jgi:putative zincin peptidase
MIETYPVTASQDGISGEYRQLLHWTLKANFTHPILIQALAIPLAIMLRTGFSLLAIYVGKLPGTFSVSLIQAVAIIPGVFATIILHECVHGLTMARFGARPQYGVLWKQLMFYATSPGYAYRRNSYILIVLAPLLVLSGLAILGMLLLQGTQWIWLLILLATLNGGGSFGDTWLVFTVLRYPATAYVVDERDGLRVLMRPA